MPARLSIAVVVAAVAVLCGGSHARAQIPNAKPSPAALAPGAPRPAETPRRASPAAGFFLDYFTRPSSGWRDVTMEELGKLPPLSKEQANAAYVELWETYKRSPEAIMRTTAAKNSFVLGPDDEPLYYVCKPTGPLGENGLSAVFIDLHGGGGTHPAVNDRDWRVHQDRYKVPGKIVAVRAPRDTWDQFHNEYFHTFTDRLVEQLILSENADPNRIYLMGYSSGGYGVIQLAPTMPDRFAAATCNAAATEGSRPENLRGLPFWYGIGENDTAYGRAKLAQEYAAELKALHEADPTGYTFNFNWVAGAGHGIDDQAAIPWMAKFTRDPYPKKVVWHQNQPARGSSNPIRHQFYWLAIEPDVKRDDTGTKTIVATCTGQRIDLIVDGYAKVRVRLNDWMFDFDQPITVTLNGKTVADNVRVERKADTLLRTFLERKDPTYAFPVELVFDVPPAPPREPASTPTTMPAATQPLDCCVVDMNAARAAAFMQAQPDDVAEDTPPAAADAAASTDTTTSTDADAAATPIQPTFTTRQPLAEVDSRARVMAMQELVVAGLAASGEREGELAGMFLQANMRDQPNLGYLLATMPSFDRESIPTQLLLDNSRLAREAAVNAPWADQIELGMFENYILPYANFDERRDNWRPRLYAQLRQRAWEHKTPLEAARWINDHFEELFGVTYHATKRPKPDMSPFESIEAKFASCTGLSILMVDACRAVGIPARVVGVPAWLNTPGNHNWVEVWDGQWFNIGDSGTDPRDEDWVEARCKQETDPDAWQHSVYALCWRPTNTFFPVVWNADQRELPALNITRFYSHRMTYSLDLPSDADATVRVYWAGELIVRKTGRGPTELPLASGSVFELVITHADGTRESRLLRT